MGGPSEGEGGPSEDRAVYRSGRGRDPGCAWRGEWWEGAGQPGLLPCGSTASARQALLCGREKVRGGEGSQLAPAPLPATPWAVPRLAQQSAKHRGVSHTQIRAPLPPKHGARGQQAMGSLSPTPRARRCTGQVQVGAHHVRLFARVRDASFPPDTGPTGRPLPDAWGGQGREEAPPGCASRWGCRGRRRPGRGKGGLSPGPAPSVEGGDRGPPGTRTVQPGCDRTSW